MAMTRARWRVLALAVVLAALAGCGEDTECRDACQKVQRCELLGITVAECEGECLRQTLDCSEQIDCVMRSACKAVPGCYRSYPRTIPDWNDDDEW